MTIEQLNDKVMCYLSPKAEKALRVLVEELGMDRDLGIAVLEQLWPENAIYDIPGDE